MGVQKGEVNQAAQDLDSHSSSDEDAQSHEGQQEAVKLQNVAGSSASVPSTSATSNGESVPAAGHLDRTPGPSRDNDLRTGGVLESAAVRPVETAGAGSQRGGTLNDWKRKAETPGDDAPPSKILKLESSGGSSRIGSINIPIRPPESRNGRVVNQWISRQGQIGGNNPANPVPEIHVPPAPSFRNSEGIEDLRLVWNQQGNQPMIPVLEEIPPRNVEGIEDWRLFWNQQGNQPMIPVLEEIPPRVQRALQEPVPTVDFDINAYDDNAEIYNVYYDANDDEEPNDAE